MGWTNQPIFMESIELDSLTVVEDLWPSDQRNVVVMDNIKRLFKNLFDPRGL